MIYFIDIGNSNIKISAQEKGQIRRFTTDRLKSKDEYYVIMKSVLSDVTGVAISSVVPELNPVFKSLFETYYNVQPFLVSKGVKTGLKIIVDNPKEVGSDLICSSVGALSLGFDPVLIVDMGTATTFNFVMNQTIQGVNISSGLLTSRSALISKTSQLSQFDFFEPKKVLGTCTVDALNNGLLYTQLFTINGMVELIKKTYHVEPEVILTGGASRFITQLCDYRYEESLTLRGLEQIYLKNQK
jgi:type III pantothenate kinase